MVDGGVGVGVGVGVANPNDDVAALCTTAS